MWLEPAVERRAEQVNGQQRSAQVTFEHGAGAGQLFGDFAWAVGSWRASFHAVHLNDNC